MQKINELLIIGAFAYWFAGASGIPTYIKNVLFKFGIRKTLYIPAEVVDMTGQMRAKQFVPVRLLPFDCEKCLAFWLGLINFWNRSWTENLMLAGCCSLIAIVIGLIINKLR